MLFDHKAHFSVARHHYVAHTVALTRDILTDAVLLLRIVEKPVPRIDAPVVGSASELTERVIKSARLDAVGDRAESARGRLVGMRQKHRLGIAVPDLFRTNKYILFARVHVKKKLCCVDDFVDGSDRVLSSDKRKERDRVEHKEERTGNSEKVAHHQVSRPSCLELGEAVKNIERVSACFLDCVMDFYCEILKAVRERNSDSLHLGHFGDKGLVTCKTKIYYLAPVLYRLSDVRLHKEPELVQTGNPPNHVVSKPDVVKSLIHFGDSREYSVKRRHKANLQA